MSITTQKTLRYMILPELWPRIKALGFSGFGPVALFVAHVYHIARLLPAGHPYLNAANKGRFTIAHVILEAQKNLKFSRDNIDQIIVFFTIPIGLILLFAQVALFFFVFSMQAAHAADFGVYLSKFFITPSPDEDITFMLLDGVFGAERFGGTPLFGSIVSMDEIWGEWPNSFHSGLHGLFGFYSQGLFWVASIILIYYIITLVGETATSGTPFGQRFNSLWAPIRLIVAIFLLIPLGSGLNTAQYFTLYIAKWGSSLATNSWIKFNEGFQGNTAALLGSADQLVATPNAPDVTGLLQFMSVVRTCAYINEMVYERNIDAYLVRQGADPKPLMSTSFSEALSYASGHAVVIRFGEHDGSDPSAYKRYSSNVRPYCGEMGLDLYDKTLGGLSLREGYYLLLKDMWDNQFIEAFSKALVAQRVTPTFVNKDWSASGWPIDQITNMLIGAYYCASDTAQGCGGKYAGFNADTMRSDALWVAWKDASFSVADKPPGAPVIPDIIKAGVSRQTQGDLSDTEDDQDQYWNEDFVKYGWAGAGIWYNKIAEMNGALVMASKALPQVVAYPEIMEYISSEHRKANSSGDGGSDAYDPVMANGELIEFEEPGDATVALALNYAQSFWESSLMQATGNVLVDSANTLFDLETIGEQFGLSGLFSLRRNAGTHPMAQLVGIGAGLIQNSVSKFGYGVAAKGLSIVGMVLPEEWKKGGPEVSAFGSLMFSIAMMGLAIGFVLYYVVPFLPFIYFFFAMGNWVKALFETMVGLPLWALAHIRIDGEGLPGPAAANGYYLLLEVLLRPTFILFGFLAGIIFFMAQVTVLHEIWALVVENMSGFDKGVATSVETEGIASNLFANMRGAVDTLFYTLIYAIVVYMLGMSSFKLIDLIPNQIMRWMGVGVSSMADNLENPTDSVISNVYVGTNVSMGSMKGAMGAMMLGK